MNEDAAYDHPPCCPACLGHGGTSEGPCFYCYGTGHPHPEDTPSTNERETLIRAIDEMSDVDRDDSGAIADAVLAADFHFAATQRPDDREAMLRRPAIIADTLDDHRPIYSNDGDSVTCGCDGVLYDVTYWRAHVGEAAVVNLDEDAAHYAALAATDGSPS